LPSSRNAALPAGGPDFLASSAVLCGVGAVLFVMVYATIAEAMQFVLVDSWKHVRPGPPPLEMPVWVVALHILIGLVVFFAIGAFVEISPVKQTLGNTWMSVEGPGGKVVTLSGSAMFRMTLGWWIGGTGVLSFFWLRRRAARRTKRPRAATESALGVPCIGRTAPYSTPPGHSAFIAIDSANRGPRQLVGRAG
jgi:hypothetical protein